MKSVKKQTKKELSFTEKYSGILKHKNMTAMDLMRKHGLRM